jgi:hypothetical protein
LQKRNRRDLLWCLLGFVVVQLGLAACVDRWWLAVRDPDYLQIEQHLRERLAEAPGRPLILFLGSSRTQMGVDASRLNVRGDRRAPVVFNAAVCSGGPMMSQVVLRRLLKAGIRPQEVFFEVMPMSLGACHGAANEERVTTLGRYAAGEVRRLWPYYGERYRLALHWGKARLLPGWRHQAELREALGIDLPPGPVPHEYDRDAYGWSGNTVELPPEEVALHTRRNLATYHDALAQPALAPGVLNAVRDAVRLCRRRHIAVTLFVPPESSAFRGYRPAVSRLQEDAIRNLAVELGVPLVNARAWVPDGGFWDGHHLTAKGAAQFTERLGREALGLGVPSGWGDSHAAAGHDQGSRSGS